MRRADADQATVTRFCNRRTPLRTRLSLNSYDVAKKGHRAVVPRLFTGQALCV